MEIVIRASAMFFIAWLMSRVVGKRGLSQMTPLDMLLVVIMGDLIQQGVTQEDMSVTGAALAVGTMALWVLAMSWASVRWPSARAAIDGSPTLLIRDGEVLQGALEAEHMPIDELYEQARRNGIGDLRTVRWGVLEANGEVSFICDEPG